VHGTRAAQTANTSEDGPGEPQVVPQNPDQHGVWFRRKGNSFSIAVQANWHGTPPFDIGHTPETLLKRSAIISLLPRAPL